ncbi:D-mannonate oxidoreductase [Sporosarcina sp. P21c]|uniref:SDR family oxidoreductase n=1 Tax=unclassified Sporosarcina TaxID=2647733 RepID=UPI000C1738F6|nr:MULTISPECIES: SDR family oxidoreductase [unclassified Sporosarcina]PIC67838.1 D-mannonate oxidoreductase [Sporosarcina sp. P16a]PIC83831.1 D-mannonate oxidoreductase [Sporosarcina sp. P1]PIC90697.1 D-mannonate oxidoreductase [Sporosarcina sp. P21c]PIC93462.1 D-mannonate oxidoreductase [Sporosarcina sp. P25]
MQTIHQNLQNKVAVVTGGSGVLCSAMAMELARHGVRIAIINRTLKNGQLIAAEIQQAGGQAIAVEGDVLDRSSLETAKDLVVSQFGKVDILINGAGGNHPDAITSEEIYSGNEVEQSFFQMNEVGLSTVFASNFTGTFLTSQVFGKVLLEQESPVILNISSMSAFSPMTKVPAYSAAKSAINNFTMWMAVHFAESNLRVNAIAPGFFLTKQNHDLLIDADGNHTQRSNKILNSTPMKRFGKPEDLLGTMLWLVDESYSSFVTGITVPVDGGFMAYSGV